MKKLTVCLAGSTGAIGKEVLFFLNQEKNIEKIITLTRKPVPNKKLNEENIAADFSVITSLRNKVKADVFICCLGSTIKKAGSKEEFRKVDYDYVINFAKLAELVQAQKILVISSMGANAHSKIFYSKVKGDMEMAVAQMKIPSIEFFRPSLLVGKRSEFRLGEKLVQWLAPLFTPFFLGSLKKYRPIKFETVARALVQRTFSAEQGLHTFESDQIAGLIS